jgi:threonine aldolase
VRDLNRRAFLKTGGAIALTGIVGRSDVVLASAKSGLADDPDSPKNAVRFFGDGVSLTPTEYTRLLAELTESESFEPDVYATGGIIEELEQKFAQLLGKETAVFLPTGTMANHIALRRLAGSRKRVIVQADSHIYNDSGDCAQKLSGLNLIPIEGAFSSESIGKALQRTATGRVKTEVGAISLESPLRRGFNTTHSRAQVAKIAELAHNEGVGLHLDGARLFMQSAHYDFSPAEFAAFFDTVYVSLYKNFNAAGGAVLAGSKETLADLLHERRMFGGSPGHVWPMAAVTRFFVDDFIEKYRAAKAVADQLMDYLKVDSRLHFELIPGGSNGLWLRLNGVDPATLVQYLAGRNIYLMEPRPQWDGLLLMINPTIGRVTAEELAEVFRAAAEI